MLVEEKKKELYKEEGFANGASQQMIMLILGVGVSTILLILTSVLGGKAYALTEADIAAISDAGVRGNITAAVQNGFVAQNQTASYLPLIVLGAVISLVLAMVLGIGSIAGGSTGGGSAL